jgi:hypothetical protein
VFLDEFPDARAGMRARRVVSRAWDGLVLLGLFSFLFLHGKDAAQDGAVIVHAFSAAANLSMAASASVSWWSGVAVIRVHWRLHGAKGAPRARRGLVPLALAMGLCTLATVALVRALT